MSSVKGRTEQNFNRPELISRLQAELKAQTMAAFGCHESIGTRLGLNTTDHKCLDLIIQSEGIGHLTPGQLAKETRLTTGAVTGVLDRLEQAGFVQREHDPNDRRRIIVRATPERIGGEMTPLIMEIRARFTELCDQYTDEELALLIEFSQRSQQLFREASARLMQVEMQAPQIPA